MEFVLAQVNIGRFRAPIDDPIMEGFRSQLDPINALADRSAGFVWRLQTEDGNATAIQAFGWDTADSAGVIINMSVWASLSDLLAFVYKSRHRQVLQQRSQWFERFEGPYVALWWVPGGHIPSVEEAKERIMSMRIHGETPFAFSFKKSFPAPEEVDELSA